MHRPGNLHRVLVVAVDAEGLGVHRHRRPVARGHSALGGDAQGLRGRGGSAFQESPRISAPGQRSVPFVGPIHEPLPRKRNSLTLRGGPKGRRGGQAHEGHTAAEATHAARDGPSESRIARGLVIESAVRLHVPQSPAPRLHERTKSARLVQHIGFHFVRRCLDLPPAETAQIQMRGVRADSDPPLEGCAHGPVHGQRVAPVEATRHVDGRQVGQQGLVVSHGPRAETLAQVGVEIDDAGQSGRTFEGRSG